MGNLREFTSKFQSTWVGLRKQRQEFEQKLASIEKYRGSAGYEREKKEATKTYVDNVRSIQGQAEDELGEVLRRMKERVPERKMDVPTPEQVRLLQVLSMRERLNAEDIDLATETLKESDTAMRTLADIAAKCHLMIPTSHKSKEEQRRIAFGALRDAVTGLVSWNGADGDEVRREYFRERSVYGGGDPSKANPHAFSAATIADVQGMEYERDHYGVIQDLVGDSVPWDAVSSLD